MRGRKRARRALCITAVFGLLALAATSVVRVSPARTLTLEIHRILANVQETKYSHETEIDDDAGKYELDCSRLLCYALGRVMPRWYDAVPKNKNRRRPLAINFHDLFAGAPDAMEGSEGWLRIPRLMDARPGGVIAFRHPLPWFGQTGHVVIIDSVPIKTPNGEVRVFVVDSTRTGHGSDTRGKGGSGVGRGEMWFQVCKAGRPVAYRWSKADGKVHKIRMAIGRPVSFID